ncbi:hypothetical protein [Dactylosporangium sp. NPDC051541]|uniref:hypothetical protein n=1 Tax=Dactylosporangium sp. NPDC051541 TaxID=3363977 RepID=UPI00379E3919
MTVTWELVRAGHLVRSVRLAPLLPAVATAAVLLVTRRDGTPDALGDLRLLALLLALGCGYVLDDSAAGLLQASPWSLARRLTLRMGCATAVTAPLWTLMLAYLLPSAPAADRWDLGLGTTIELAAALGVVWAVAAWARRRGVDHPGLITSPALLAALLLAASMSRAPMLVSTGPQWTTAHLRWSAVLAAATVTLLAAMRDPAHRLPHIP